MGRSVKKMELTAKPGKAYVSASALCDPRNGGKLLAAIGFGFVSVVCLPDMTKQEESRQSRIKRAGETFTRGHCTQA